MPRMCSSVYLNIEFIEIFRKSGYENYKEVVQEQNKRRGIALSLGLTRKVVCSNNIDNPYSSMEAMFCLISEAIRERNKKRENA